MTEFRDADVDVDAHSDGSSVDEKHAELGVGPVREARVPGALLWYLHHNSGEWVLPLAIIVGYVPLADSGEWVLPDFPCRAPTLWSRSGPWTSRRARTASWSRALTR